MESIVKKCARIGCKGQIHSLKPMKPLLKGELQIYNVSEEIGSGSIIHRKKRNNFLLISKLRIMNNNISNVLLFKHNELDPIVQILGT